MQPRHTFLVALVTLGLSAGGSALAQQRALHGTFEGRGQGSSKLLHGQPSLKAESKVRVRLVQEGNNLTVHATTLSSRIGTKDLKEPIETRTTGRIVSDKTDGGMRRLQVRFEGPGHATATQHALDSIAKAAGFAEGIVKVDGATQDMVIVHGRDGRIQMESKASITRGKAAGFLDLVLKKTITTEDKYDLRPAAHEPSP